MVSSGEEYKPGLYDSKNKPLPADVVIGGGSQIKTNVSALRLRGRRRRRQAVPQRCSGVKLERGGGNGVSPFDEDEGYVAEAAKPQSPFDPDAAEGADDEQAF
jgi:hypothetical protein